jgi:hypothetical protein
MKNQEVIKALMAMAVIYNKNLNEAAVNLMLDDLESYEPEKILSALKLCRLEINRFPTTSEIIKRIYIKTESSQGQEILASIFHAISWFGYTNPQGARRIIGEIGWKAVNSMGGWQRLCDSPADDASILRAQLRKAVESAVEENTRCDVLGIKFEGYRSEELFSSKKELKPMRQLDYSSFTSEEPASPE